MKIFFKFREFKTGLIPFILFMTLVMFSMCKKEASSPKKLLSEGGDNYYGPAIDQHSMTPGLVLLPIRSYQQSTEYTCGPAAVLTLLRYYGRDGDEMTIAREMGTSTTTGTTALQMASWMNSHGFTASWHEHGTLEMLRENLSVQKPTLVEWSDWGGHWVMVIGYDTRNTESMSDDVILFADPYDRHDDHEDGVTWFNAGRFYYMWYDALLFGQTMHRLYIEADPR